MLESVFLKPWSEEQPSLEQGAIWLLSRAKNYPKKRALELLAEALYFDREATKEKCRQMIGT